MVRHNHPPDSEDQVASSGRLAALGLRTAPSGWVPSGWVAQSSPETDAAPAPWQPDVAEPDRSPPTESLPAPDPPAIGSLARSWAQDRIPIWAAGPVERIGLGRVLAGMAVVLAMVVAGVVVLHHHAASGYGSSYEASTTRSSSIGSTSTGSSSTGSSSTGSSSESDPVLPAAPSVAASAASIVVDVGGRVRKPGLVTLPAGARVADAVAAAGGALRHKAIATLDLAARVTDGELLLIGVKASGADDGSADAGDDGTEASGSPAPVSLSSATIDELETLPGVGPVTAQQIIDWRTAHNGFTAVEQLQQVTGIGPAKYAEISPLVTP